MSNISNNTSNSNLSSYLSKEVQNTSNYSISKLNQLVDIENTKSKLAATSNSFISSSQNNSYKSKDELLDNINKLLEENESKDIIKIRKKTNNVVLNNKPLNRNININTSDILSLTLELQETKKTNEIMKQTISDLKSKITKNELIYKEELSKKLKEQKFEFDNAIQRLNDLIENLLSEKKKLNLTIQSLNDQLGEIDLQHKKQIQALMDSHNTDTQKNKDAWFQAEKMRRKKWEEEKIKEIKEMTIKSLEPELDKILKDHKEDLFKQEENLREDFRRQKERLITDYEEKVKNMKNNFNIEKEKIQDEERKSYIKRLREQNERIEDQHTEDQKKWYQSLQDEIARLEQMRVSDKKHYEEDLELIEQRHIKDAEEKEFTYKAQINKIKEQYDTQLNTKIEFFRDKNEKEKNNFIEEKEKEYNKKLEKVKAELKEERDKQLNIVIKQLTDDMVTNKNKETKEIENKANQMNINLIKQNETLKEEIQNKKNEINSHTDQYAKLRVQYENVLTERNDKDLKIAQLNKDIVSLNQTISELQDKYTEVQGELTKRIANINVDYQTKIDKERNEQRLLKEKSDLIAKNYENKIMDLNNEHKQEMEDLENKITKAIKRKEETITRLNNEILIKNQTIKKYEELLNKQRNEFISNYKK